MQALRTMITCLLLAGIVAIARGTAMQNSAGDAAGLWALLTLFCIIAIVTLGHNGEWE